MALTREDVRAAVERAGDEHWRALVRHHEDAYPASRPTPGDVARREAERLNGVGLGDHPDFELLETRVERAGADAVRLTHVFRYRPLDIRLLTEPYTGYAE
jgi:hypothetical protein